MSALPIDLRSDTVTLPTSEMLEAMASAELGDDVYGEDPTVRQLEELAADMVGKDAALFVPSGTMGNAVAVLTHTKRGEEAIVDVDSHVYDAEVGGLALLAGVQARALESCKGQLTTAQVEQAIRPEDVHCPRTSLLCLENPHNAGGGTVMSPSLTGSLADVAGRHGVAVHLDGARIFNGAISLGVDARVMAGSADSVMFCLSKGLCAPVGSILAGDQDWIARARKNRKLLGGGMRQAGVLAAAGIVALHTMIDRLADDHDNAQILAEGLAETPGFEVDLETVQTNMVFARVEHAQQWTETMRAEGVLTGAVGPNRIRFVTHKGVTNDHIRAALGKLRHIAANGRLA